MSRFSRRARRFFWWCAAADAALLDAPDAPALDGIKYAAVGALVCLTATVATCGWMHNAATMLAGELLGLPLAAGLGLLMGALVFCMERVLVVSIRQDGALIGKFFAFIWRGLIASLSAALITVPFALAYFNNGILARLDTEKLALMAEKRQVIDGVYDLRGQAAAITAVDRSLATNRTERDQLPADVRELAAAAANCEREHNALKESLQPKIAAANRRYASTLREIDEYPDYASYLHGRLRSIAAQIGAWKKTLAEKDQACQDASGRVSTATQEYHARVDQQWQAGLERKQAAQRALDHAQQEANATLLVSDEIVARSTAPDLSARVGALGQMAQHDWFVAVVLAVAYGFFFLIDIMPVLAKLVMRTLYDPRVTGEYRRALAHIEAEAALAEADAAMRTEMAKAERHGVEMLLRQTDDEDVRELAKSRIASEIAKIRVVAPFAQVNALTDAYRRTQAQADNVAERCAGRPELFPHIEAVRDALSKAMERAAGTIKSQPSGMPTA